MSCHRSVQKTAVECLSTSLRRSRRHLAGYRELLNSAIEEVCSPQPPDDEDGPLPDSQIGVSFWTSDEKEAFFSALAVRAGKKK